MKDVFTTVNYRHSSIYSDRLLFIVLAALSLTPPIAAPTAAVFRILLCSDVDNKVLDPNNLLTCLSLLVSRFIHRKSTPLVIFPANVPTTACVNANGILVPSPIPL